MSSTNIQSFVSGQTSLYIAEFLCEFCFGRKLIYFIEKSRTYPQKPVEFMCPHCLTQTTFPLQMHHRTKKVTVQKIEDRIILSLLSESSLDESEVIFFGAGRTIERAFSELIKRYDFSELVEYLKKVSE